MMLKYFYPLFIFVFLGCGDVKTPQLSKPQESYLQATRKTEIIYENRAQVVVIATHLNEYDLAAYPPEVGEVFFVDVYHSQRKQKSFFESGYALKLSNGAEPLQITPLKREELQGEIAQNATRWGEYYLIKFAPQEKINRNNLKMIVSHRIYGENILEFGFKKIKKY